VRLTVSQLSEAPERLESEWRQLAEHVREQASDLVLLPEMPFFRWLPRERGVDAEEWSRAVEVHEEWLGRFPELVPAVVLGTRPVLRDGRRLNEGFVWDAADRLSRVHDKVYLPNEEGFWEASWYERGEKSFELASLDAARVGYLICTEMWFTDHAREYARQGIEILAAPRATMGTSVEKWLAGGRAAAVMSGAFCLSSNRGGVDRSGAVWAGTGWIIEPEEGEVLARTSEDEPFVTREVDLRLAAAAKSTYPRYVQE
jgi:N-carbamoylputrescine amidase